MAHIVAEPCIGCKHTTCVEVCPVDCFHQDTQMLVIDPEECIDCAACITECPEEAIFQDFDLPKKWESYIQINADKAQTTPLIIESQEPLIKSDNCQGNA